MTHIIKIKIMNSLSWCHIIYNIVTYLFHIRSILLISSEKRFSFLYMFLYDTLSNLLLLILPILLWIAKEHPEIETSYYKSTI